MYAGGNVLEDFAIARAERDLKSLIDRAPRIAHRRQGSSIADIPIEQVVVSDVILVRAGEVIPIDGIIISPGAMIDEKGGADRRTDPGYAPGGRIGTERYGQRRGDVRNSGHRYGG